VRPGIVRGPLTVRTRARFALLLAFASALVRGSVAVAEDRPYPGGKPAADGRSAEPRVEQLRAEGVAQYKDRRYFEALRSFESALRLAEPRLAGELKGLLSRTRSALGVELFNAGEIRQAAETFREALKDAPDGYAHFGLAFVYFVKLEDGPAREHLDESLRLEPRHGKTHKLLALLEYRRGESDAALARMEEALRLDASDREARTLVDRWKTESRISRSFVDLSRGRFLLRADPSIPSARIEDVARRLEAARKSVGDSFQLDFTQRIVVVLYAPERFHTATGSYHWVGGLFDGQLKLPLGGGASPSAEDLEALDEALRHEMTHAVVRSITPECPNWLNEGLAQHFERPGRGASVAAELRAQGSRVRLEDVPVRLWEVDDESLARKTYLQGLGFVEFLVAEFHEFRLRLLLEAIREEGSLKKAFERTYGLSLHEAEDRWWSDVTSGRGTSGKGAGSGPGSGAPR
jgi:tetratricopeptide (TPR) repeat protein